MIVPVNRAELYCSTCGTGPVCLVPTAIGTRPYEHLTVPPLSERLTLVYVDLRGGGRSTGQAADLTFDLVAEDFDAVRVALGAERVAILGHSILGVLAIEYARRCPSRVSHVIAVGTPPRGDMTWLAAEAASFFERDASEDRKRVLQENLAALPPGTPPGPGAAFLAQTPARFFDARLDAAPLFAEAEVKVALLGHMGALTREWDVTTDTGSLRTPIFLAHGRCDYTVPWILWRDIAPRIPGATLHVFERSGHHPFFEEPYTFTAALTDWMNRARAGAGSDA